MACPPALIDRLLNAAEQAGTQPRVVDISADFRYPTAEAYAAVYKHAHGAPERLDAVHLRGAGAPERAARRRTSRTRAASPPRSCSPRVPLLSLGLVEPRLFVTGVTGSTGSGRTAGRGHASPAAPQRPLCLQRAGPPPCAGGRCARAGGHAASTRDFAFVPHSGPFARGIHVTVQAVLHAARSHATNCVHALREFYDQSVSCAWRRRAAREGRRRQQLRAALGRQRTAARVAVMCVSTT